MSVPARYTVSARFYDILSLEWPVYRAGRVTAIGAMGLLPGMRVLDLGCGTGLNHPLLVDAVGPTGTVIGVICESPDSKFVAFVCDVLPSCAVVLNW